MSRKRIRSSERSGWRAFGRAVRVANEEGERQISRKGERQISSASVVRRRLAGSPEAAGGLVLLCVLVLLAVAGPYAGRWDHTEIDYAAFGEPPSADHWFGTTPGGKDVYALTLCGMRTSLIVGLLAGVTATGAAAVAGTFAGYFGGRPDRLLMWLADLLLVLPAFLIVAIMSPPLRGSGPPVLALLLAAFLWPITARVVRGMTISLREREYVLAARYLGVPARVIVCRHIVPNLATLLITDAALTVSAAVIAESGLSYFGLGVQPPDSSLGTVIADSAPAAAAYPWAFCLAAGLLVLIVLGVNLVGDGLRDALDPAVARGRL
jgi:peptide/nickel transport system permease protein